ncbi:MAG: 4Fe-4S binding protein [Clostridia bacterium]|nr:4Fe-4S binding protein [Clostridia bacterium]
MKRNEYIINRIFTPLRNWSWLFIPLVALVGLWYPKMGLLMIPMMIALPILGFFKGKFWCGNICPHGSLFDRFIYPISFNKKIPAWAKAKITLVLAFIFFMFMFTKRVLAVTALWGTTPFLDKLGFIFVMNYFMVTIIGTFLAFFINPRTWCRFCPMATFQLLAYKLGKFLKANKKTDAVITISNNQECLNCGKCAKVCPVDLSPYQEISTKGQLENEACIRCSTCVVYCPVNILSLKCHQT